MAKTALIVPYGEVENSLKDFENKRTVLVGGCFDLLHFGHLQFLNKAAEAGDFLIIALESDEFIMKSKRKIPVHNQSERAQILASLNMVSLVVLLPMFDNEKEYSDMVELLRPKVIAVTEGDPLILKKKTQAGTIGAEVKVVLPLLKQFSTRKIITEIS